MNEPVGARRAGWGMPAVTVCGLAAALLWSGTLTSSEGLLGRGFATAMAKTDAEAGALALTPAAYNNAQAIKPVAAVWPGLSAGQTLGLQRPLTLGDHITIASADGRPEKLSVVGLAQVDGASIGAPGLQFQMVTSRSDDAGSPALVRFLIAIEPPAQQAEANKTL